MKAKLIYCTKCRELTLQMPQDKQYNTYLCNCGQENHKTPKGEQPDENNQGKQKGKD